MDREKYLERSAAKASVRAEFYKSRSRLFSLLRLTVAATGIATALAALYFGSELLSIISVTLLFLVFTVTAKIHGAIKKAIQTFERWQQIKQMHLHRQDLNWQALPDDDSPVLSNHPFAKDLDIGGPFSLHRLLNNCVSKQGSRLLLRWLTEAPEKRGDILKRQQLVKELIPLIHFRDKTALLTQTQSNGQMDSEKLNAWLQKSVAHKIPRFILPLLGVLAGLNIVLFLLYYNLNLDAYWIFSLTLYILLFLGFGRHSHGLFTETVHLNDELQKTSVLLLYLQHFNISNKSALSELLKPVQDSATKPGSFFSKLKLLLIGVGLRQNPIIGIFVNLILPVDFILINLLERFKQQLALQLPPWFEVLHRLDALSALADFAWLHPHYTFPQFSEMRTEITLTEAGHPLIPAHKRVVNDFHLDKEHTTALLTGSNMSGKSTFLRTLGCNLALAFSGSVVCAAKASVSLLRIHTCIRVDDTLDQGLSYFYAEVKRLKSILNAIEQQDGLPVFYLIDEIFKGTNNRERLIGSRAYIQHIVKGNGIGLVTSHDLELTVLEEELPGLQNYHFEEQIVNGRMQFDYKLKVGPSPSTNALKIMKMEGLPAGPDGSANA